MPPPFVFVQLSAGAREVSAAAARWVMTPSEVEAKQLRMEDRRNDKE